MAMLIIPFIVSLIISIVWTILIDNDKTTQEERDNTPFP